MANLFDYLMWRGDLSFDEARFCEVDNLVLSKLCCPDLTGFAPAEGSGREEPLCEVTQRYFAARAGMDDRLGLLISGGILPLMRQAAATRRFSGVLLSEYVNRIDERITEQFSALTFRLGDGSRYAAFRGTDDTLAGWKENFNMSFLDEVPAQRDAAAYLTRIMRLGNGLLRVGGHSKGGNLAVYAAMHCAPELQSRILCVYNNDGPGFKSSVLEQEAYRRIRSRVVTLVPQSSIVGMLLEHEEDYEVVKSTAIGPVQHDGMTWETAGPSFVHLASTTGGSRYLDRTLKTWVNSMDEPSRRAFTDALFDTLYGTGARTLTELNDRKLKNAVAAIKTYRRLDATQRQMLHRTLHLLWKAGAESFGAPPDARS